MFLASASAAATERSQGGPQQKRHKSMGSDEAVNKVLWQLDSRVRTLEGKAPSWFLAADDPVVVPAMINANKTYDDRHTKGVAHPMGPRRTTLAAGFLSRIAMADLKLPDQKAEVTHFINQTNTLAAMSKTMTIEEQQVFLKHLLSSYTTPQLMEPEIASLLFFKCKKQDAEKKDRYFFQIELQPSSPLIHCYPFIRLAMIGANAIPADGPPPAGPLIRDIPRGKK